METKRFAIVKNEANGQRKFWVGPVKCWHVDTPNVEELLTEVYAKKELERLKVALPHVADDLVIFDVVAYKTDCSIYGKAFREFMIGKDRTEENLAAAREAGNRALSGKVQ